LKSKVVIADVDEGALADTEKELRTLSGIVRAIVCDVTREDHNRNLAKTAIGEFGAINLVAPFAGITSDGLLIKTDKESGRVIGKLSLKQFQQVIDINLSGVFRTVRECVAQMVNNASKGLICLVWSTGSFRNCRTDQLLST